MLLRSAMVAIGLCAATAASAQSPKVFETPRLADGHPDFQGVWRNSVLITPLEANPAFGENLVVSAAQARTMADAIFGATLKASLLQVDLPDHADLAVVRGEHRTRLIVEPADGKIPFLPGVRKRAADWIVQFLRVKSGAVADNPDQMPLSDRCISLGGQPPMHPGLARQIVQSPGYVLISLEGYNETRIIRMGGAHLPVRTRLGDSIGHWEGDVLVVETSGFRLDEPIYISLTPTQNPPFVVGPDSKVIERFTRSSPDELDYTFTIEDPSLYAGRWLGEYAIARVDESLGESACHEGNAAIGLIIGGARSLESLAALGAAAPNLKAEGRVSEGRVNKARSEPRP